MNTFEDNKRSGNRPFSPGEDFNGLIVYRRKVLEDPVLSVYYLKGEPVYAESFLVKGTWWEGLLSPYEVEDHLFGDIFGYATEKYGERYVDHLKRRAKEVVDLTLESLRLFGWEVEEERHPYEPEEVASMFHIPLGEGEKSPEGILITLNALGFPIYYIAGDKPKDQGFLKAVLPMKEKVGRIMETVEDLRGSLALVLPLFIVGRLDLVDGRVWVVIKDVRRIVFALRYLPPLGHIGGDTLRRLAEIECCRYVLWKTNGDRIALYDGEDVEVLDPEAVISIVSAYLKRYDRAVNDALSKLPSRVPSKMKEMLLQQMVNRNPYVEGFAEEVFSRFGIRVEYE